MKKRAVVMLLIATMGVSLTACGKGKEKTDDVVISVGDSTTSDSRKNTSSILGNENNESNESSADDIETGAGAGEVFNQATEAVEADGKNTFKTSRGNVVTAEEMQEATIIGTWITNSGDILSFSKAEDGTINYSGYITGSNDDILGTATTDNSTYIELTASSSTEYEEVETEITNEAGEVEKQIVQVPKEQEAIITKYTIVNLSWQADDSAMIMELKDESGENKLFKRIEVSKELSEEAPTEEEVTEIAGESTGTGETEGATEVAETEGTEAGSTIVSE